MPCISGTGTQLVRTDYERQTVDAANPVARFAHRRRLAIARRAVLELVPGSAVVDWGCGQGRFLSQIADQAPGRYRLTGWDPMQAVRFDGFEVLTDPHAIEPDSVDMITALEVCEHLGATETDALVEFAATRLRSGGVLLITVPVMMGPALFVKELNRMVLFRRPAEHTVRELMAGGLLARPAQRAEDILGSHKGYDFRITLATFRATFGEPTVRYSPLPIPTWYGNSQAVMCFRRP
jgi:2-polyprenyl-3-methyl-5-hydroxy-6-metoxy-1,4-benzoquinol methylase